MVAYISMSTGSRFFEGFRWSWWWYINEKWVWDSIYFVWIIDEEIVLEEDDYDNENDSDENNQGLSDLDDEGNESDGDLGNQIVKRSKQTNRESEQENAIQEFKSVF